MIFKKLYFVFNIILLQVEKGMTINIPIYPIHHDPAYYANPEKFDPERFSDENKHKINQFIYMPFGIGPRNCIGKFLYLSSFILRREGLDLFFSIHAVTDLDAMLFRY